MPVTNGLSASDHVRGVVINCSDSMRWEFRALTAHGMSNSAIQIIFACSAWWGFTNATDQRRVNAFLRRSICCGRCPPDLPPFEELCQAADQQLFSKILTKNGHLLHRFLLPPTGASQNYILRIRPAHNRQLTLHSGHLTDINCFTRILYANIY